MKYLARNPQPATRNPARPSRGPKHSCGGAPRGGAPGADAGKDRENGQVAEPWMIDELEHAGPEHLDPAFVAGFDRKQGYPEPDEDLAVFEAHGLGATSAVVDIGAGTGQFALAAARLFGHVTAVDVSPAMVSALRRRAETDKLANLECVQAGFLSYARTGPPADGVYTRHALHQLPDFWKALALHRIAGMLRPGGVLRLRDLIYDFPPGDAEQVFRGWFKHAAADPAKGYTADDYAEHIRAEFSTFRWLLEPMLAQAGFEIVAAEFEGRLYGAYTCVKSGG
jgi:ubiquinone/menaquinone biosynthesis C-methylase UbiE